MGWNDDGRSDSALAQTGVHNRPQRRTMQVIEVRMRDQHKINGRQIGNSQARTAQPFEDKQPRRKIRVDYYIVSTNLQEKARVPDEGNAEFSVVDEARFVSFPDAGSDCGMPHQFSKLAGTSTKSRIAKRLLDHPAAKALSVRIFSVW